MTPENYQDHFFSYHLEGALRSAEQIIPLVLEHHRPQSVIDIGCGTGAWLSAWKKAGVQAIHGVDGDYVNKSELLIGQDEFEAFDLEKGFQNGQRYELVSCLEVAEHIQPAAAEKFVASLCRLGDLVLFSAAIPGQEGTLHVNEQYPPYWVALFGKNGFVPVDCFRMKIWENPNVQWWYRQNLLFFVKETALTNYPSLESFCKNQPAVIPSLVHPEIFDHKTRKSEMYERILKNPFRTCRHFAGRFFRSIKNLFGK